MGTGTKCGDEMGMRTSCVGIEWEWGQFHGDKMGMGMLIHPCVTLYCRYPSP